MIEKFLRGTWRFSMWCTIAPGVFNIDNNVNIILRKGDGGAEVEGSLICNSEDVS